MDLGSRIGPRVDWSLLEGIYSPEKVGSQAITLAGNGVRADTQLVMGGGPGTTQARRSHHGVFSRITTTSWSWALSRHLPSPPALGSILGGFGWSFPKLILSQRCRTTERTGTHNQCWLCVAFRLNTHTNVDRCTGTLSLPCPGTVGGRSFTGHCWNLVEGVLQGQLNPRPCGQGAVGGWTRIGGEQCVETRNTALSFMKLLRIFKSKKILLKLFHHCSRPWGL